MSSVIRIFPLLSFLVEGTSVTWLRTNPQEHHPYPSPFWGESVPQWDFSQTRQGAGQQRWLLDTHWEAQFLSSLGSDYRSHCPTPFAMILRAPCVAICTCHGYVVLHGRESPRSTLRLHQEQPLAQKFLIYSILPLTHTPKLWGSWGILTPSLKRTQRSPLSLGPAHCSPILCTLWAPTLRNGYFLSLRHESLLANS